MLKVVNIYLLLFIFLLYTYNYEALDPTGS